MCTYNIILNDRLVNQVRPAFDGDFSMQNWIQDLVTQALVRIASEQHNVEADDGLITDEERAYWQASIERDLRNRAEGKPVNYLSGDEFWKKFDDAINRHYEGVHAEV